MTSATNKKADIKTAAAATPVAATAPAPAPAPALIAYYAIPVPRGQQPVLTPIGAAVAHDDGEGFTLQLHLTPPAGGHIILRKPQVKKAA